jgi:SulP family sulfate permease
VRFVLLDLALVPGVDMSAAEAFVRVQRVLAGRDVGLCFVGCNKDVERAVASVGLLETPGVEVFADGNEGMEWVENVFLRGWYESVKEGGAEQMCRPSSTSLISSTMMLIRTTR